MANITNLSEDFFSAEPRLGLISLSVVLQEAITKPIEGGGWGQLTKIQMPVSLLQPHPSIPAL